MVAESEGLATKPAFERFLSSVYPSVGLEFSD